MATIRKFQFDVDFDAVAHAPAPKRDVAPPPPPPPSYSEEELAAARDEAMRLGHAAGLAEAKRAVDARVAAALATLEASLAGTRPMLDAALERSRKDALTLAAAVARRLVPATLARDAVAAVESVVADLLPRVIDEPRLVIRVGDPLIEALKEPIDALAGRAGYAGRVILLGDERLTGADCRVEWADGGAEHNVERLSQEIAATVDRFLNGVRDDSPAADDPTLTTDPQETVNG